MRTTIDKAGRVVVPKVLRDQVGLPAGEVEVTVDGAGIRIEPVSQGILEEHDGHLFLPAGAEPMTSEQIRAFRLADQR